jgi:hypothetical protein
VDRASDRPRRKRRQDRAHFQHIVTDINKDGLNDILTSTAPKYGIFWYEQQRAADGTITWKQHVIDARGRRPTISASPTSTNDGNKEIVTGKRFKAHNGGDPDEFGKQSFFTTASLPVPTPFSASTSSVRRGHRCRTNTVAVDMDGDGDLDLVTTGKWGGPIPSKNRMTEPVSAEARREGLRPLASAAAPAAQTFGDNLAFASRGAKASSDSELDGSKGCTARLNDGVPATPARSARPAGIRR